MGQTTIEWTARLRPGDGVMMPGYTFNGWIGCTHVSPGCEHCYAEMMMDQRYGRVEWGKGKPRVRTSAANWRKPLAWDKQAAEWGMRLAVFSASLSDWLDEEVPIEWLADLLALIERTPHLDWLLLSKRIDKWSDRLHQVVRETHDGADMFASRWLDGDAPSNAWIGTSVEDQRRADERIPYLLRVPAAVRFLSCEPLLSGVDLSRWIAPRTACGECGKISDGDHDACPACASDEALTTIYGEHQDDDVDRSCYSPDLHWVIAGGESGYGARPCWPEWAYSLRDQCQAAGAAFFWKQWGEYEPYEEDAQPPFWRDQHGRLHDGHGLNVLNPETGEVNKGWHEDSIHSPYAFRRVGKHAAGRLLDGAEWSEFPETTVTT
jgi:protein gp37